MAGQTLGETIIVGAGQAGLSVAFHLGNRGVVCRVLEAEGSPGNSWRKRWDSLRLFTPAQHCSLPGMQFPAPPGSLLTKDQVATYLECYAAQLPVTTGVVVTGIHAEDRTRDVDGGGAWTVESTAGRFTAANVVIATGATSEPFIPDLAAKLAEDIRQLHSSDYRNAQSLPEGGVLVVGAGTSGIQIAMELARDHRVWLAGRVPFHVPDAALKHAGGLYWQFIDKVLTRRTPLGRRVAKDFTAQGGPLISVSIDDALSAGVRCLPRFEQVDGAGRPYFPNEPGMPAPVLPVSTVIWATGYKPSYGWIDGLSVDSRGWPVTNRGEVHEFPGLYFVGLPFQYGLTSALLGGVGRDSAFVADRIAERE
ncbi:NAD(P)/FAD-dependent oxidoreductase [Arthrobacter sp. E3]|uniref:flavin-containing monooxygenase n=1 Tax=Arthrobacter sp. E3 TaxID=517402 RepID=UPI001A93AB57|nr:NAD(P)/FAD-dependent oxidoreductase [Arthrobacter sp. E3]